MPYSRLSGLSIQKTAVVEIDMERPEILTILWVALEQIVIESLLPGGGMRLVRVRDDTVEIEQYRIKIIS